MSLAVVAGCSGATSPDLRSDPLAGSEGGECIATGTPCDVGLVCLSNRCVRPAGSGGATDSGGGEASMPDDASPPDSGVGDADSAPPECKDKHPLLDGGARFCAAGDCYCSMPDNCYPKAEADACCSAAVTCY